MNGLRLFSQPPDAVTRKHPLHALLTAALVAAPMVLSTASAQLAPKVTARDGFSTRSAASADPRSRSISTPDRSTGHSPLVEALRNKHIDGRSVLGEAQYRVIDSLINAFSYFTGGQEPLVYDPASNTLATIKRGPEGSSDNLYILTSRDLGQTWTAGKMVYDGSQGPARYPSLLIINPKKSDKPADLLYYFTAALLNEGGTDFGRYITGLADDQGTALGSTITGDVNGSTWATTSKSLLTASGSTILVIGDLSENNLGLRRFNAEEGTISAEIPAEWSTEHFSDPGSPTSRTAVTVGISRDMTGTDNNIYAGIFSRFPDAEANGVIAPYPAISTSTDNGLTWSAFDVIPRSVITAYGNSQGVIGDSVRFLYNQAQDFMVTGPNKVSFILDLYEINADKGTTDPTLAQIVEAYRENGTWGMRKVADITGSEFRVIADDADTLSSSQLGNEVQVARTADGMKLIVKWTDLVSFKVDEDLNADGDNTNDTLVTNDVFVASRPMAGGSWGSPVNVTNSMIYDRVTWIPTTLPNDLTKIPLLSLQRAPNDQELPKQIDSLMVFFQQHVDDEQYVVFSSVDGAAAAGVEEAVVARSGMKLESVYPNPTGDRGVIRFTTTKPGRVMLDLFSVTGERAMSLQNGTMETGEHTIAFSAAGLAPGVYYYRLMSNGETLTKAFTVIR
jgi:hypothetical protein